MGFEFLLNTDSESLREPFHLAKLVDELQALFGNNKISRFFLNFFQKAILNQIIEIILQSRIREIGSIENSRSLSLSLVLLDDSQNIKKNICFRPSLDFFLDHFLVTRISIVSNERNPTIRKICAARYSSTPNGISRMKTWNRVIIRNANITRNAS